MERTHKKSTLEWLNKLCHIPLNAGAEQEVHRQEIMITLLMLTGSVVITGISLWDILYGSGPCWGNITTLSIGLLAAICYNVALLTGKTSIIATLLMMTFLHFFWLITCDVELMGMLWCLVLLPLFFFLLGYKCGGVIALVIFLFSSLILLVPNWFSLTTSYSSRASYGFLLSYLVLCWVSFIVEYIRFQTRSSLQEAKEDLNLQAGTDELTGLSNRRGFKQYIGEVEHRTDMKDSFAVIVGDLDHFKQINDQYGHEIGDFVLKETATTLKSLVRADDLVVRWGGEEFLLLLVDTDLKGAQTLAEKIRHKIATTYFSTDQGKLAVSMSLGVDAQKVGGDLYATLGSADKAMYEAKNRGRNCVVVSDASADDEPEQEELDLPV